MEHLCSGNVHEKTGNTDITPDDTQHGGVPETINRVQVIIQGDTKNILLVMTIISVCCGG